MDSTTITFWPEPGGIRGGSGFELHYYRRLESAGQRGLQFSTICRLANVLSELNALVHRCLGGESSQVPMPSVVHDWTRYWVPWDTPIHVGWGREAYLLDPEESLGRLANRDLKTLKQLTGGAFGCLVLSGEPGMGKTHLIQSWTKQQQESGTTLIDVNFRAVPDRSYFDELAFKNPEWKAWREGSGFLTLIVDGVDEGVVKIPGFVAYLAGRLRSEPIDRLRIIMICRSLEWPVSEGATLIALWQAKGVKGILSGRFELCNLRRKDVAQAAKDCEFSAAAFLTAVRRNGLIAFANRPLTLRMLLREYGKRHGFSKTRGELIRSHIRALCEEIDPERRQSLLQARPSLAVYSTDDIYRTARRIAALMHVCGKSAVFMGKVTERRRSDLTLDEITSPGSNSDNRSELPKPDLVQLALQTPLFTTRGNDRVGFYHQVLAEVLAADFLSELPTIQQTEILCNRDQSGRFVEPPLCEIAAWLAMDSKGFREQLLSDEPAILLRGDVSHFPSKDKAKLVETLILRAREEKNFDAHEERYFYHGLKFPGLGKQLSACIVDRGANVVARRMALTIAAECKVHSVMDDVLRCLTDVSDTDIARFGASKLGDLMRKTDVPRLEALLTAPTGDPIQRRTRYWCGYALLESGSWELQRVLRHLPSILGPGATDGFLLAQFAKPSDTAVLLSSTLTWPGCFDVLSPYHPFAKAGFTLALEDWRKPSIRRLLARVWIQATNHAYGLSDDLARPLRARCDADEVGRHGLIEEIARCADFESQVPHQIIPQIMHADDLAWLLTEIFGLRGRARSNFARLIAFTFHCERHVGLFDSLLAARKAIPAVKREFPWLRLWRLDEPLAKTAKERHYENIARAEEFRELRRPPRKKPLDVWKEDFRIIESAPSTIWIRVAGNLFYVGDESRRWELDGDLTHSPGWRFHNLDARRRIRLLAREFLLRHTGERGFLLGNLSDWGIVGYQAILLLSKDIPGDRALASSVRKHWVPTIINWFSNDDKVHKKLVSTAYRLSPAKVCSLLKRELARGAVSESGMVLAVRKYSDCWDDRLRSVTIQWVKRFPRLRAETLGNLTAELLVFDKTGAWQLWKEVSHARGFSRERRAAVLGSLVDGCLWKEWPRLRPIMRNRELARAAFFRAAADHGIDPSTSIPKNTNSSWLADVHLLLRQLFPREKDDPIPEGHYSPTRMMDIARWRESLPQALAAQGTKDACLQLERIAAVVTPSERIWIRWHLNEAIEASRLKAWIPVTVSALTEMAADADRRFLRTEDDLVSVVLESLKRMESVEDSRTEDFWRESNRKGKRTGEWLPIHEEEITRLIAGWLRLNITSGSGITVQREVRIRRSQRTDIEVRATGARKNGLRPLEIILEIKGDWNREVRTGMRSQLIDRYLKRSGRTHGIYVVIWTGDPKIAYRQGFSYASADQVRSELNDLANSVVRAGENYVVSGVVIDAKRD